jgi:hypothetical protein
MALLVNDFVQQVINKDGLAKGSHFAVTFLMPPQLADIYRTTVETLSLRCESISFPSRAPLTSNVKYFGPERRMVYGYDAAPITASILLSESMAERDFFLAWQDIAVGYARQIQEGSSGFGFLTGYYQDYTCKLIITKFNERGERTHNTQLIEAFPQFVGEVAGSWGDGDFARVNVTFQYRYFVEGSSGIESAENRVIDQKIAQAINSDFKETVGLDPRVIALIRSATAGDKAFRKQASGSLSALLNNQLR